MGLLSKMRRQTAVHWPLATGGTFDEYGRPELGSAEELRVRWEDVTEEFLDPQGQRQISSAVVYVAEDLKVGGVLMLGTLTDVDGTVTPKENDGAFEIRQMGKNPNLAATKFLRTAFL